MKVVVLGAGIVGVSTAWFLARAGHEVQVIDRAIGAARETSFANGGQLSVSQSEPWAQPDVPLKVLRWLAREDAPLLYRFAVDPAQWRWCARFLYECLPGRAQHNMRQMLAIGGYSRHAFDEIEADTGIHYDRLTRGIVSIFESQKEFDAALHGAQHMAAFGIDKHEISRERLFELEPGLAHYAGKIVGATYCASDRSGDVHKFTTALAVQAEAAGVRFRYSTRINALHEAGGRIASVSLTGPDGAFAYESADAFVVALGSHAPLLLRQSGIRIPVYPLKGYSATVPVKDAEAVLNGSLTDEGWKIVMSRLGDRLRIAGTAELDGYSSRLNPARCKMLIERARTLFPDACDWDVAQFWTGLRPATPGNVPLIGPKKYPNLYLNTGHGTLGWTEGPGSGKALAELVSGRRPDIDFDFLEL